MFLQVFPDHELAMVVIGTIKGNGSGVIKPVTRLNLRGSSNTDILNVYTAQCTYNIQYMQVSHILEIFLLFNRLLGGVWKPASNEVGIIPNVL